MQSGLRESNGFDLIDDDGYLRVLDSLFALVDNDEQLESSGIAWETRQGGSRTDGALSYFVLTDRGLYFPVTHDKGDKAAASAYARDVHHAVIGETEEGFVTLDLFDDKTAHLGGITIHPMSCDGHGLEEAGFIAGTLGLDETRITVIDEPGPPYAGLGAPSPSTRSAATGRQAWEYTWFQLHWPPAEELNEMGAEGWEAVGLTVFGPQSGSGQVLILLKRPRTS